MPGARFTCIDYLHTHLFTRADELKLPDSRCKYSPATVSVYIRCKVHDSTVEASSGSTQTTAAAVR